MTDIGNELTNYFAFNQESLLEVGSLDQEFLCLAVFDRDSLGLIRLRGAALLTDNLQVFKAVDFGVKSVLASLYRPTVLYNSRAKNFLILGQDLKKRGLGIWHIAQEGGLREPELQGRVMRAGERMGADTRRIDESIIYSVTPIPGKETIYVQLANDSLFEVKQDGSCQSIFQPGEGALAIAKDWLAISPGVAPNSGNNCFILSR